MRLLAPHLTDSNHEAVLYAASHKSKREVEDIVARLQPRPDVPSSARKLPSPIPTSRTEQPLMLESQRMDCKSGEVEAMTARNPVSSPESKSVAMPLAPGRYKIQFTVSEETYRTLRRVQDLLRHQIPTGDPAVIFDRALTFLLADVEKFEIGAHGPAARSVKVERPIALCPGGSSPHGMETGRRSVSLCRNGRPMQ